MARPYTRALDPTDYADLPHAEPLRAFEAAMTAPHCRWHPHKIWENASILQELDELGVPKDAAILDVGSGGTFFPCYLATVAGYPDVTLTDSMANKDITADIAAQRAAYGIRLPLHALQAEDMAALPSASWDVVLCISTIEHVDADQHDAALREICRLTKPGGVICLTSDYFRHDAEGHVDAAQFAASPYKDGQATPYRQPFVEHLPNVIDADFVGGTDLAYRGDFVHNYSFVNICLRKRSAA